MNRITQLSTGSTNPADPISLREGATLIGCHERTIRRWISTGDIAGYRVGPRMIRVSKADLLALAARVPSADAQGA